MAQTLFAGPQMIGALLMLPVIFTGSQPETVHITANTAHKAGRKKRGALQRLGQHASGESAE